MKINFKKPTNERGILFISINSKNTDEIIKEGNKKTFYLKCDEKMTLRKLFPLGRKMIIMAKSVKAEKISFNFNDFKFSDIKISDEELAEIIGTQLDFANYEFVDYKSKKENIFIKEVYLSGIGKNIGKYLLKGQKIALEVNKTRTLANTPGGDMTPKILAEKAKKSVKGLPVKVNVLGEKEMEKQKMQAILSVGR